MVITLEENKSRGAQHLTSLDFDISGILQSLQEADKITKEMAVQIGKNAQQSFQDGFISNKSTKSQPVSNFVDEKSISSAKNQIKELESEYGKLAKTVEKYNESGSLLGGKNTFIDTSGIETVVEYNEKMQKTGETITANYAKAEKAAEAAIKKEEKLRDDFYKKNISQIDAEIAERERQSKVFSAQIKEQMTLAANNEKEQNKVSAQIESQIEKQKQFNTLVSNQRSSSVNKGIISENNAIIKSLENLNSKIKEQGYVTKDQSQQFDEYKKQIKDLGGRYQEAGTKGESFLQKISDKAKWLGAFYVVNELKNYFFEALTTIKETEDAVVSLQRVLSESISRPQITEELYSIATEYGRTFQEVAEVSQLFVQAGNNWTDTIELTHGTMLALNTAELDVTQSTEGLIAVMAQWELKAEDYADLVDKINITADDFAVTSETIVSALQRSSSSAKNANISLEETIGIITALAEATGRSGENIGTALNSLIIYTSKAGALETFAENGSEAMKQVVSDYQKGAASIYDVWVQLSNELKTLTASQQSALFNSEEYQEFADELESQATEFTSQVNEIYGAAGTYRQNYFIALLNDMSKADEAIKNMSGSEGYSIKENEKYMESLTANWNQLKSALAELAVQVGESGLLDLLKLLTNIGTGLARLTKDIGGIIPLLTTIGGIIVTIKGQKIQSTFSDLAASIVSGASSLKNFKNQLLGVVTAQNKVSAANELVKSSFGWIGIITSAIGILVSVFNGMESAAQNARDQAARLAQDNLDQIDSMKSLKEEYAEIVDYTGDATEKNKQLEEFKKKLVTQYNLEREAVDKLNGSRKEEINLLNGVISSNANNAWVQIEDSYLKAVNAIENATTKLDTSNFALGIDQQTLNIMSEYFKIVETTDIYGKKRIQDISFQTSNLHEQRDVLAEILANENISQNAAKALKIEYNEITKQIEKWEDVYSSGVDVAKEFFLSQSDTVDMINKIANASSEEEGKKLYDQLISSVKETNFGLEAQSEIIDTIIGMFPQFSDSGVDAAESISASFSISQDVIDSLSDKIDELNGSINDFQSGYDAAIAAMEEYNENGYLSVDTIQSMLSAGYEYVSLLDFTANGISLNKEKTQELLKAQTDNVNAMIQQTAYAGLLEIANRYLSESTEDVGDSAASAAPAVDSLEGQLNDLANQAVQATFSVSAAGDAIDAAFRGKVTGSNLTKMKNEMTDYLSSVNSLSKYIGNLSTNTSAWSNNASKAAETAAKNQTDALKKQLEAQKEAIKDRYDAQIDALKEVQEENDRLQKQEEYYRNRQEALKDISKAESRSGVEYREQEDEARQKLEELDREWQETVKDWSIEDKVAELEALRDAEVAAIDAQIDALENGASKVGSSMVSSASSAAKDMASTYNSEYLEPITNDTKESFDSMYSELPEVYGNEAEQILEIAKLNSMQMYNIYEENFFSKMKQSMNEIRRSMIGLSAVTPSASYPFITPVVGNSAPTSNVTNNTRNATVFANIYGENSANSLTKSIFSKP